MCGNEVVSANAWIKSALAFLIYQALLEKDLKNEKKVGF